jgi:hypothetical protein
MILKKNPNLSQEETKNKFLELIPAFRHNEIFLNIFPDVYGIETAKMKLNEQK